LTQKNQTFILSQARLWRKQLSRLKNKFLLSLKPPQRVFDEIYKKNRWGDRESVSGPGSRLDRTDKIRRALPYLVDQYQIRSLLDIPCGDYNWMSLLSLKVDYTGADIVPDLIEKNQVHYRNENRKFMVLNLIQDRLPAVDLILCRDCLVHFSSADIKRALKNIKASGSKYFLSTTFPQRTINQEIVTGEWRPVNLCLPPFNLPAPVDLLEDSYDSPNYFDKHLGLWRVTDIPDL
jgi:hypothetical protein